MAFLISNIKNISSKNSIKYLLFFALGIILALSIKTIWANWTPPLNAPPICDPATTPGCNTPINVSSFAQTKTGDLTLPNLYLNAVGNEGNIYRTNIIQGNNDLILYSNSAKNLPIFLEGSPVVINNDVGTGNVGIGTATPTAKLEIAGQIKMTGGAPGAGKVLTSDTAGLASWQPPAAAGVGGSGTAGYIPKFTAGTTIGNTATPIYESGTKIGIGTTNPQATLHVGSGSVWFPGAGGGTTHFNYTDGKNYIRGTTIIADTGGNVGIGISGPGEKLDVAGNIRTSGNLSTNNYSTALPNGWSGIQTNDLWARWSVRANQICLGGGGGGTGLGTCRTSWLPAGDVVTATCSAAGGAVCTAWCPGGYEVTGGGIYPVHTAIISVGQTVSVGYNFPNGETGWQCGNYENFTCYARCIRVW